MIRGPVMQESAYYTSKGKMTRSKYENKIKELGIDLQERNIVIGRKTNQQVVTLKMEIGYCIIWMKDKILQLSKRVTRIEFSNFYI